MAIIHIQTYTKRFSYLKACALIGLAFIHLNLWAQTYPGKIGVGLEAAGGNALEFVDAAKVMGEFEALAGGSVAKDANGWPLADCKVIVFDHRPFNIWNGTPDDPAAKQVNVSGTYKLSFTGNATIADGGGTVTVTNKIYNSATNTTTADINLSTGKAFMLLKFSGTSGGIKNMKLIRPGYPANTKQVFRTEFLNALAPFSTIRFMDWRQTNNCDPIYPATMSWSQRKLLTDATQRKCGNKKDGVAWEYVIELANITGKDIWINIPASANDDYIIQLASLLKSKLNPNTKIYIEHSNEVWNGMFGQYAYNKAAAKAEVAKGGSLLNQGAASDTVLWARRRHIKRVVDISNLFKNVYGTSAMNTTVRPVFAYQIGGWRPWYDLLLSWVNTNFGAPKNFIYSVATAPYISGYGAGSTATISQILAYMTQDSNNSKSAMQEVTNYAVKWGLKHMMYETGPDQGGGSTENIANRILSNRDPGMKNVVKNHYINNWFPTGGDLAMFYVLSGRYSRHGCWGSFEDLASYNSPKYQALCEMTGYCANPPTVNISSPTEGASVPSPFAINVTTADVDGTVSKVEYFQGSTKIGESSSAPFSFTWSAASNGSYAVTAKATDNTGKTFFSKAVNVTVTGTTADVTAPAAPANLISTGKTASSVGLSWTAPTDNIGVTGYQVFRGTTLVTTSTSTSYTVTGLTASTAYSFTIKAKDAANNISAASNALSVTTSAPSDAQAPAAPTNLTSTGKTATSVSLSWTASTDNLGVTGYQVFRGTTLVTTSTSTSYTVTGLTASTAYSFTVKAKDAAGNISAASNALGVTTSAATTNCTASGTVSWARYNNIPGKTVANLTSHTSFPGSPSLTNELTIFEAPPTTDENYGTRIRGYICAPATGIYYFWIAGDNNCELWLSIDENTANRRKIASITDVITQPREWSKYASQKSAGISLTAGKKYFIEALHKQGPGNSNVAVGWQLPSGVQERPIPGTRLSPMDQTVARTAQEEEDEILQLDVFPNPAKDQIIITFNTNLEDKIEISISDIYGKFYHHMEKTSMTGNNSIDVNISHLNSGIYFVNIIHDGTSDVKKIIVTK